MLQVTRSDSANSRGDVLPQGKRAWGETFFGDGEAGPPSACGMYYESGEIQRKTK